MSACEQNIRRFLRRQIGDWAGLNADCGKREVLSAFSFAAGEGVAHYGAKNLEFRFHALPAEGFAEPVFFYFIREQLKLIAAEFWSFYRTECLRVQQQLGEPACRLDFMWQERVIPAAELLYPDRGIAIGLIPDSGLFASVRVFPPCSVGEYQENYWNTKPAREFAHPK